MSLTSISYLSVTESKLKPYAMFSDTLNIKTFATAKINSKGH